MHFLLHFFKFNVSFNLFYFLALLADNLNAEISLGTVTNVEEAVQWLSYTYLYVRMRKNPLVYGMKYAELKEDPLLDIKRTEFIQICFYNYTHFITCPYYQETFLKNNPKNQSNRVKIGRKRVPNRSKLMNIFS